MDSNRAIAPHAPGLRLVFRTHGFPSVGFSGTIVFVLMLSPCRVTGITPKANWRGWPVSYVPTKSSAGIGEEMLSGRKR